MKTHVLRYSLILSLVAFFTACDSDEPEKEDTPELITRVTLTFTPTAGGTPVVVTATDPDGEGVQDLAPDQNIQLNRNTEYRLELGLINGLVAENNPAYDVAEEVEEEGDEHMFFFGWTNNLFSNPAGNGNIDNRADAVRYIGGDDSVDDDGLPLGLTTTWTTANAAGNGDFRIILKHQPDLKSNTSSATDGETDIDVSFSLVIQ